MIPVDVASVGFGVDLVDPLLPGCGPDDVHDILRMMSVAGVPCWVDGGWGVDALLTIQTRPHRDLDLALPTRCWGSAVSALESEGFGLVRDDGVFNQVFADSRGRVVDLHSFDDEVVVVDADGVRRHGPNGLAYEAGGFGPLGLGRIAGRPVQCMTAQFQVRSHTGYVVDAEDHADVSLLCQRFGIPMPSDYASFEALLVGGTATLPAVPAAPPTVGTSYDC